MRPVVQLCSAIVALSVINGLACADIILEFTKTDSGGVRVVGTGAGNTSNFGFATTWQILDFDNDFIRDSVGHFNVINADTVTGTISNSWGVNRNISGFGINRSESSNDDIQFTLDSGMFFWINQPFNISFEAIFNSSSLSPAELSNGNYVDNTASGGTEIFGTTSARVSVPEPLSASLIVSLLLLSVVYVRHKFLGTRNVQSRMPN